MRRIVLSLLGMALAAALIVSATASGASSGSTSAAKIKVAFNKKLKRSIVVDGRGRTLYMYVNDKSGTSTCTPQRDQLCADIWPPLSTTEPPVAGKGIKASLLSTATTPEGVVQVTYNRHPLYYFRGGHGFRSDRKPGQVRGQGIGALWYVLSPKGKPIRKIPDTS